MIERPSAPATERNKAPILDVLQYELRDCHTVLEIGSGTGQHAVHFAAGMPQLSWQTSDLRENHAAIAAWVDWSGLDNVLAPLEIEVSRSDAALGSFDAVFSANTAHIMSFPEVECMFGLVGKVLHGGGKFCLYGPFNRDGAFTSESNKRFDGSLRMQEASMGIRELEDLSALAELAGLGEQKIYAMPSNNLIVVWRKQERPG
jgi:cyclopropane fatty-acyl-phospholipid synthase-like methyltransferase